MAPRVGSDGHPIPEKQGIVTALIAPVQFNKLKWDRLFPEMHKAEGVQIEVKADPKHHVVRELMQNLPRCSDNGLREMRDELHGRLNGEKLLPADRVNIEACFNMIIAEIDFRLHERKSLFDILAPMLGGPLPTKGR